MKKVFLALFACFCVTASNAAFTSCGPGYILEAHKDIDGIKADACQKLWCMDLENGKSMGKGDKPASGYRATSAPVQLCSAGKCVECFGERKWCAGEPAGQWNESYGAYTRAGADSSAYTSQLKGSCYAWRLEKPECPDGTQAILTNGAWHCVTSTGTGTDVASKKSSIRRTGAIRRMGR